MLADYADADLSILYRSDIFDATTRLDFQDGTKGPFFIQVLADGVLLHGEDVYGRSPRHSNFRWFDRR